MDKKNTILLTVIAVATLLVAVVGSTFAFFAVQSTNQADVKVTTTTAKESDVFSATGTGAMILTVNNDVMMESSIPEGSTGVVAATDSDESLVVTLKAGSGIATCTYDLVWKDTSTTAYKKTTGATALEYTIAGTSEGLTPIAEINVDAASKLGSYEITNKYADNNTTTQNWKFTTTFYNLATDQKDQLNKTYTGSVTVQNVVCRNAADTTAATE